MDFKETDVISSQNGSQDNASSDLKIISVHSVTENNKIQQQDVEAIETTSTSVSDDVANDDCVSRQIDCKDSLNVNSSSELATTGSCNLDYDDHSYALPYNIDNEKRHSDSMSDQDEGGSAETSLSIDHQPDDNSLDVLAKVAQAMAPQDTATNPDILENSLELMSTPSPPALPGLHQLCTASLSAPMIPTLYPPGTQGIHWDVDDTNWVVAEEETVSTSAIDDASAAAVADIRRQTGRKTVSLVIANKNLAQGVKTYCMSAGGNVVFSRSLLQSKPQGQLTEVKLNSTSQPQQIFQKQATTFRLDLEKSGLRGATFLKAAPVSVSTSGNQNVRRYRYSGRGLVSTTALTQLSPLGGGGSGGPLLLGSGGGVGIIPAGAATVGPIRCPCGYTHDDGYMIQCDKCKIWQHVDCVLSEPVHLPSNYLCDACFPRSVNYNRAVNIQRHKLNQQKRETFSDGHKSVKIQHKVTQAQLQMLGAQAANRNTIHASPRASKRKQDLQSRPGETSEYSDALTSPPAPNPASSPLPSPLSSPPLPRTQTNSFYRPDSPHRYHQRSPGHLLLMSPTSGAPLNRHGLSMDDLVQAGSLLNQQQTVLSPQGSYIMSGMDDVYSSVPALGSGLVVGSNHTSSGISPHTSHPHRRSPLGLPHHSYQSFSPDQQDYEEIRENQCTEEVHRLLQERKELGSLFAYNYRERAGHTPLATVVSLDFNRKRLEATQHLYKYDVIMEYKGFLTLFDHYNEEHDFRKHYNPFVLYYNKIENLRLCINARYQGNHARFIRRSCAPNCQVVHSYTYGRLHLLLLANEEIPAGTELSLPFDFDYTKCRYQVDCACTRKNCEVLKWYRRQERAHQQAQMNRGQQGYYKKSLSDPLGRSQPNKKGFFRPEMAHSTSLLGSRYAYPRESPPSPNDVVHHQEDIYDFSDEESGRKKEERRLLNSQRALMALSNKKRQERLKHQVNRKLVHLKPTSPVAPRGRGRGKSSANIWSRSDKSETANGPKGVEPKTTLGRGKHQRTGLSSRGRGRPVGSGTGGVTGSQVQKRRASKAFSDIKSEAETSDTDVGEPENKSPPDRQRRQSSKSIETVAGVEKKEPAPKPPKAKRSRDEIWMDEVLKRIERLEKKKQHRKDSDTILAETNASNNSIKGEINNASVEMECVPDTTAHKTDEKMVIKKTEIIDSELTEDVEMVNECSEKINDEIARKLERRVSEQLDELKDEKEEDEGEANDRLVIKYHKTTISDLQSDIDAVLKSLPNQEEVAQSNTVNEVQNQTQENHSDTTDMKSPVVSESKESKLDEDKNIISEAVSPPKNGKVFANKKGRQRAKSGALKFLQELCFEEFLKEQVASVETKEKVADSPPKTASPTKVENKPISPIPKVPNGKTRRVSKESFSEEQHDVSLNENVGRQRSNSSEISSSKSLRESRDERWLRMQIEKIAAMEKKQKAKRANAENNEESVIDTPKSPLKDVTKSLTEDAKDLKPQRQRRQSSKCETNTNNKSPRISQTTSPVRSYSHDGNNETHDVSSSQEKHQSHDETNRERYSISSLSSDSESLDSDPELRSSHFALSVSSRINSTSPVRRQSGTRGRRQYRKPLTPQKPLLWYNQEPQERVFKTKKTLLENWKQEECNLIVYKPQLENPMERFSRSLSCSTPTSQVEHQHVPLGTTPTPTKKRWLSQAILDGEEDVSCSTPLSEPSLVNFLSGALSCNMTPVSSSFSVFNTSMAPPTTPVSSNATQFNPKKRLMAQFSVDDVEEAGEATAPSPGSLSQFTLQHPNTLTTSRVFYNAGILNQAFDTITSPSMLSPTSKLPPKKATMKKREEERMLAEMRKVRVSLTEYRRRRGLQDAMPDSSSPNQATSDTEQDQIQDCNKSVTSNIPTSDGSMGMEEGQPNWNYVHRFLPTDTYSEEPIPMDTSAPLREESSEFLNYSSARSNEDLLECDEKMSPDAKHDGDDMDDEEYNDDEDDHGPRTPTEPDEDDEEVVENEAENSQQEEIAVIDEYSESGVKEIVEKPVNSSASANEPANHEDQLELLDEYQEIKDANSMKANSDTISSQPSIDDCEAPKTPDLDEDMLDQENDLKYTDLIDRYDILHEKMKKGSSSPDNELVTLQNIQKRDEEIRNMQELKTLERKRDKLKYELRSVDRCLTPPPVDVAVTDEVSTAPTPIKEISTPAEMSGVSTETPSKPTQSVQPLCHKASPTSPTTSEGQTPAKAQSGISSRYRGPWNNDKVVLAPVATVAPLQTGTPLTPSPIKPPVVNKGLSALDAALKAMQDHLKAQLAQVKTGPSATGPQSTTPIRGIPPTSTTTPTIASFTIASSSKKTPQSKQEHQPVKVNTPVSVRQHHPVATSSVDRTQTTQSSQFHPSQQDVQSVSHPKAASRQSPTDMKLSSSNFNYSHPFAYQKGVNASSTTNSTSNFSMKINSTPSRYHGQSVLVAPPSGSRPPSHLPNNSSQSTGIGSSVSSNPTRHPHQKPMATGRNRYSQY